MKRCPTHKRPLDAETAADDARRLGLRAYNCPRCGAFHLTKRRRLRRRPTYSKLNARECERVWAA
jgi:hypothetical protein